MSDLSRPTSLQYRLGVDIGHLVLEAMQDGVAIQEATATLKQSLWNLERAEGMGIDLLDTKQVIRPMHRNDVRYRWLRERDLNTITNGGLFAGRTPENVVINGEDLDREIDAAMAAGRRKAGGA